MTSPTSEVETDTLIREFFHAWERNDSDYILSCFTDDAIYHNMPLEPLVGKEAIRQFIFQYADSTPGIFEILHQVVSGDLVMNERLDRVEINGLQTDLPVCGVFEIQDRKIKAWRDYFDLASVSSSRNQSDG